MPRFSRVLMFLALMTVAGLGLSACSGADFAASQEGNLGQAPLVGLSGDQEASEVADADSAGATDVSVDADDEGDVADDAGESDATDPLEITTDALKSGTVGIPYQDEIKGHGGSRTYTWSIVSGDLPAGLLLCEEDGDACGATVSGRNAAIRGTPEANVTRGRFVIRMADAKGRSVDSVEKSFSIAITSPITEDPASEAPAEVAGPGTTIAGITLKLINMPQTVELGHIQQITLGDIGKLYVPIESTLTVAGGKAPYAFKVVTMGQGSVEEEDGAFKLVITHLYPLYKNPDEDPEIPVTVLVRDAHGRTAMLEKTIKVLYPMSMVTDLHIWECDEDDENCINTELNYLSVVMIKGQYAYAGFCAGNNGEAVIQNEQECVEATTGNQYYSGTPGYTWVGMTLPLDQVTGIWYAQIPYLGIDFRLHLKSHFWSATIDLDHEVGGSGDILPFFDKTPQGHVWHRRASALMPFAQDALNSSLKMQYRIDDFLSGN